jgi:hypothetical protein
LLPQLEEVTFSEENQIRKIDGFQRCSRLRRIENLPRCWKICGSRTFVHRSYPDIITALRNVHVGLHGRDLHQSSSDDEESPDTDVQTQVATSDVKQRDGGSEEESMEANRMIEVLQRVFRELTVEQVVQFIRKTFRDVTVGQFLEALCAAFGGTTVKYFVPDLDPLGGIIAYLTEQCDGNVHDCGVVIVSSSGSRDSHSCCAAKNAVDLKDASKFISSFHSRGFAIRPEGNNWICCHFKDITIIPTHYSIRSDFQGHPGGDNLKSWRVKVSMDGRKWIKVDDKVNNSELDDTDVTRVFPVARVELGHFIRLINVGVSHGGDDQLVITSFEVLAS